MSHPVVKRLTAPLAVLLLTGASAFAVDTQLLNLVMPDAQVMAGINVVNAEISPFGQYILTKVTTTDQTGLQDFIKHAGFDPTKDVSEILAASAGNAQTPSGLLLVKGNFDLSILLASLQKETGVTVAAYGPATLVTGGNDTKVPHAVAFLNGTIAIAGDVASVKAAVDRSASPKPLASPALAAQVQTLSMNYDAWSVSIASLSALIPGGASTAVAGGASQPLMLVKNIVSANSGVKFGANVQFAAQAVADTPANASSLADIVKMLAGLAAMSTAGQNNEGAAIAALLQSVQVTTDNTAVNIAATVPETQLEAVLNAATVKKADAAKARKM